MKSTMSNLIIFAAGAAIGSLVTWKIVKTKYERIANEAIESMEEYYSNKYAASENTEDTQEPEDTATECEEEDFEVTNYNRILAEMRYATENPHVQRYTGPSIDPDEAEEEDDEEDVDYTPYGGDGSSERPYIISADEFGDFSDYTLHQLTYYSDGFLTTILDELVDDADDVVGFESLNHFDDDVVFVRNDRLKSDYEITLDMRKYRDVIKSKPHHMEVE